LFEKVASLLGLARRAGQVVAGSAAGREALAQGKAHLVIVAEDAGRSTRADFLTEGQRKGVPVKFFSTKGKLGAALGTDPKAVVVIKDAGFAQEIEKILSGKGEVGADQMGV
jgi:ribosomal protein L7Ae-like RNA K-turn-binding protein